MTTVTLDLPTQTMAQAKQAATTLQRPVEDVLIDILAAVLPSMEDVSAEIQVELTRMTWLDNQELWDIAKAQISDEAQLNLQLLSQAQASRTLASSELEQLESLRQEYGRITLLKARAYSLLSLRGGKPLLQNN